MQVRRVAKVQDLQVVVVGIGDEEAGRRGIMCNDPGSSPVRQSIAAEVRQKAQGFPATGGASSVSWIKRIYLVISQHEQAAILLFEFEDKIPTARSIVIQNIQCVMN